MKQLLTKEDKKLVFSWALSFFAALPDSEKKKRWEEAGTEKKYIDMIFNKATDFSTILSSNPFFRDDMKPEEEDACLRRIGIDTDKLYAKD